MKQARLIALATIFSLVMGTAVLAQALALDKTVSRRKSFVMTNGSHTLKIPRTGQTQCYDPDGKTISCAGTGQDGDTLTGGEWATLRFTDQGNGTLLDNSTGLNWPKDAETPGPASCAPAVTKPWQSALDHIKCLNTNLYLGFADWRLPNRNELTSLIDLSQADISTKLVSLGFSGVQPDYYWSSSSTAGSPSYAWIVDMSDGFVVYFSKSYRGYVWPVRGGV